MPAGLRDLGKAGRHCKRRRLGILILMF